MAETIDPPVFHQLNYITEGEVVINVCEDEFVAYPECIVDVPKLLPHGIKAKTSAVIYDLGGTASWYNFLNDYTTTLRYRPENFLI